MKAALLYAPEDLRVEETREPTPGPGEGLVAVQAVGLCGTDYRIWKGLRRVRYPLIMGHEIVGRMAAVGPGVSRVKAGIPVAVEPNYSCGACDLCHEGRRNICLKRTAIGIDVPGGLAQYVTVPERCLWPAPQNLTPDQMLLVEPLAVMVRAVSRGQVRSEETAAIVGAGTLGLLGLQVLRSYGARVLVVSRSHGRLALARALGADAVCASSEADPVPIARAFSGRDGVDLVVESAGTPQAVEQAVALARPGGRVVLVGLPHGASAIDFSPVVRREIQILGSLIYRDEFGEALTLLADGKIQTEPLITHRFPLAQIREALLTHPQPDSIKVTVTL